MSVAALCEGRRGRELGNWRRKSYDKLAGRRVCAEMHGGLSSSWRDEAFVVAGLREMSRAEIKPKVVN